MTHLDTARKIANKSTMNFKLAALIVKGGNIRGVGFNHYTRNAFPKSTHAEVDAIQNAGDGANNATIWVFRFGRNGGLALAKPCKDCIVALNLAGIKEIVYSTKDGLEHTKLGLI